MTKGLGCPEGYRACRKLGHERRPPPPSHTRAEHRRDNNSERRGRHEDKGRDWGSRLFYSPSRAPAKEWERDRSESWHGRRHDRSSTMGNHRRHEAHKENSVDTTLSLPEIQKGQNSETTRTLPVNTIPVSRVFERINTSLAAFLSPPRTVVTVQEVEDALVQLEVAASEKSVQSAPDADRVPRFPGQAFNMGCSLGTPPIAPFDIRNQSSIMRKEPASASVTGSRLKKLQGSLRGRILLSSKNKARTTSLIASSSPVPKTPAICRLFRLWRDGTMGTATKTAVHGAVGDTAAHHLAQSQGQHLQYLRTTAIQGTPCRLTRRAPRMLGPRTSSRCPRGPRSQRQALPLLASSRQLGVRPRQRDTHGSSASAPPLSTPDVTSVGWGAPDRATPARRTELRL